MADDDDVVAVEADQTSPDEPQAEEAAPVEAEAVDTEGVSSDEVAIEPEVVEEAPVEASAPAPPDISSLTLAQLAELNPELAEAARNAGAQQREAQLRREAGSEEATAARLKAIRERLLANPEDPNADPDLSFLDQNNLANATQRILSQLTEGWIKSFEPTEAERAAINEAATSGNLSTYGATVLSAAARKIGRGEVFDLDVSEIPPDSKLMKSILAREARRAADEEKAAALEQSTAGKSTNGALPRTPAGGPVETTAGDVDPLLIKLEQQGRAALSDSEVERAKELLGLKRS